MSSFQTPTHIEPSDIESFDNLAEANLDWLTEKHLDLLLSEDSLDNLIDGSVAPDDSPFLYTFSKKEMDYCCLDEDEHLVLAPDNSPDEHLVPASEKSPDEDLVPSVHGKCTDKSRSNKKRRRTSQSDVDDFKGKCCLDPSHTTFRYEWRKGPLGKSTLCTTCSCAQQRKTLKWTVSPTTGKVMNSDRSSKKHKLMVESPSVIQEAYRQGLFDKSYLMTTQDSVSAVAV